MKFVKFILPLLFLATTVNAQNTYYGHKVGIDFNVIGRKPIFKESFEDIIDNNDKPNYRYKGSQLEAYSNFDWGFATGITFFSKQNVSFAAQFTYYTSDIAYQEGKYYHDTVNDVYYDPSDFTLEDMKYRSLTFMPVLSVTSEELIKPIGLTHEFGLGFMKSSLVDKDYHYKVGGKLFTDSANEFYDKKHEYSAVCAMYGLKLSKPLTKSIVMNFGLRYTLMFGNRTSSYEVKQGLNRNFLNALFGFTLLI